MKKHLTYQDDKSDKFWNIETSGILFTVTYGEAGTGGLGQTKTFDSKEQCLKEADKLVRQKVREGYYELNEAKAANKDIAWTALETLEIKWGKKYPHAVKSWKTNWQDLSHFFDFPLEIRTLVYTTNIIENLNGKIRKYTKTKMSFPDDASVLKSVYLALQEITRKWTLPVRNWNLLINQFINIFGERCKI